jgi:hypothetical protein
MTAKTGLSARHPKKDTISGVKTDSDGYPNSRGMTLLRKYRSGGTLTARQAILANCCECMGYYVDGRINCDQPSCPFYKWMPYPKPLKMGDL